MELRGSRVLKIAGAPPAATAGAPAPSQRTQDGTARVTVTQSGPGRAVSGAEVAAAGVTATTDGGGIASLQLPPGEHTVTASRSDPALDHVTFASHYPEITLPHKAASRVKGTVDVRPGATAELRVALTVHELLVKVVLYRRHIDFGGQDKYGHWWTVIDDVESFGWWPKYPLGDDANQRSGEPVPPRPLPADPGVGQRIQHLFDAALYRVRAAGHALSESTLVRTFRGVEGELNGVTSFGGQAKRMGTPSTSTPTTTRAIRATYDSNLSWTTAGTALR